MSGDAIESVNLNTFDFFDGSAEATGGNSITCIDRLAVVPRANKILYGTTICIFACAFISLVLCCVAVAQRSVHVEGLLGGAIAMLIIVLIGACVQVVFWKDKDVIISI